MGSPEIIQHGANPANAPERGKEERTRIPMSVPQLKLAVPDIPGYHLHWMLGTPERLAQARRGGYVRVEKDEVDIYSQNIADSRDISGGTGMGSEVSVVAGGDVDNRGQPVLLVLMKLKQEWWDEDQKELEKRSDQLIAALRSGKMNAKEAGEQQGDERLRYVDRSRTSNMFTKRRA